jgi:hypothetical protein
MLDNQLLSSTSEEIRGRAKDEGTNQRRRLSKNERQISNQGVGLKSWARFQARQPQASHGCSWLVDSTLPELV